MTDIPKNPEGFRIASLVVREFAYSDNGRWYLCDCDCGGTSTRSWGVLNKCYRDGTDLGCGCRRGKANTHGYSKDPLYPRYLVMIQRCYNPKNNSYPRYGGRGISVCQRWLESYENFIEDMGLPPKGASIERIDNDGDYCPENCKWADHYEQANNKRNNHFIEYQGRKYSVGEFCRKFRVHDSELRRKVFKGKFTLEEYMEIKKDPLRMLNGTTHKYISLDRYRDGGVMYRIREAGKCFPTLEKAIEYRNWWLNQHD